MPKKLLIIHSSLTCVIVVLGRNLSNFFLGYATGTSCLSVSNNVAMTGAPTDFLSGWLVFVYQFLH